MYQKELMALGVHPWQVYAREQLEKMGIPIPEGANVLSLYQTELMKRGTHNFQVYAGNMLAMMGVEVREGDNVLIIYQKELLAMDVHPWQVYAREQLEKKGIPIPDGADVLSLYQKQKMVDGTNPFQVYAANMLRLMGEKIDDDDDVIGIYQKALMAMGVHPLQNMSDDQIDKKDINARLSQMSNALPGWKTNFDKLCKWPANAKPPTQRSFRWLWNQKQPGTQGIQSKVDFEALHNTEEWRNQWNSKKQANITGTEWKDNHAKLKKLMKDKKWGIVV
jgi:NADPH-dependent 7-cyano-7-deazaguanine reductase QueF-like protein